MSTWGSCSCPERREREGHGHSGLPTSRETTGAQRRRPPRGSVSRRSPGKSPGGGGAKRKEEVEVGGSCSG
ncbi:hypothetical protein EYF80_055397 [Liparis tanakae]|uniref:Uncharacterized protein n=1 Tax=Liparis tanakae TaxID=230148 RepID=A0A4Z2EZZ4_9TELE|nr:hypothetical protein EYF80_055397 [Liparis tanakae]